MTVGEKKRMQAIGREDASKPSMLPWYAFGLVTFPLFPVALLVALIMWIRDNNGAFLDVGDEGSLEAYCYEFEYARTLRNRQMVTAIIGHGFGIIGMIFFVGLMSR